MTASVLHHEQVLHQVAAGNEIVYVPCHRSHMDYLLLSYIIYTKGFAIPHIAAGVNLNMPVIGRFLRKGGAFFLRRSFRGDSLYPVVFMKYLGLMMARGHSLEYFIEGGRSRTGRLLPPKTGMLSMTVRSFLRDPARPVVFIPVYFGYERLVEGETYIGELSGQPKKKESVWSLLRSLPSLRRKFGKVHVSLGEPIDLGELIRKHHPSWNGAAFADDSRPAVVHYDDRRSRAPDHGEHQRRSRSYAHQSDGDDYPRDAAPGAARERRSSPARSVSRHASRPAVFARRSR